MSTPHITVCICTFRRPDLLLRLLQALERQETRDRFTYSVVVCDNDAVLSARPVVEAFSTASPLAITYCAEPRQNIALARNRVLSHARGAFVAWIDDDEFPVPEWLERMLDACERHGVAGVLGPVRPHFDTPPPRWVIDGRFCERPEHPTGTVMHWTNCRTGNVLLRRDILKGLHAPFRSEFGTGGEDVDFFRRMSFQGHVFVWCNEGIAYELVPPSRWKRTYMFRRALLRGRNTLKIGHRRVEALLKSAIAVPAYSLALPATLLFGQHVFVKYGIKFCDHLGRVLALLGIHPLKERPM